MFRSLLYKEFRAHRLQFSILSIFLFLAYGLIIFMSFKSGSDGSAFQRLTYIYHSIFLTAIAMLSRFLFVDEFKTDTRMFLDALPIHRWKVILVKIIISYAVTFLFSSIAILCITLALKEQENMTIEFFFMLVTRFGLYAVFLATFSFTLSLLGKYRIALWVLFVLPAVNKDIYEPAYDFIHSLPAFQLLKNAGFEREFWPISAIVWSCVLIIVLTASSYFLALFRNSNIVYFLYKKMSDKERFTVIAITFCLLILIVLKGHDDKPLSRLGMIEHEEAGIQFYLARLDLLTAADKDIEVLSKITHEIVVSLNKMGISPEHCADLVMIESTDFDDEQLCAYELIDNETVVLLTADYKNEQFVRAYAIGTALYGYIDQYSKGRSLVRRDGAWIAHGVSGYLGGMNTSVNWSETQIKHAVKYFEELKKSNISIEELLTNHDCLENIDGYLDEDFETLLDDHIFLNAFYTTCFNEIVKKSGEEAALNFAKQTILMHNTRRSWLVNYRESNRPVQISLETAWGTSANDYYDHLTGYFEELTARNIQK